MRLQSLDLIDSAPVGVWLWDADGAFIETNQVGAGLLAREQQHLVGTSLYGYAHECDRASLRGVRDRLVAGQYAVVKARFVRADGVLCWLELSCMPVGAGSIVAFCRDTTASNERSLALSTNQRHLQTILDVFPGVVGSFDRELRVRFANREYARLFGYELNDLCGAHMRDLIGPEWFERLRPKMDAVLRGEPQSYRRAVADRGHDNCDRYLQVNLIPDRVGAEVIGMVAIGTDVTDIMAAQMSAESANRAKTEFLANMSHEIRTPLNSVLGFARLGVEESNDSPILHDFFRRISESGRLLLGVVNDALDLTKIEAGEMQIESIPLDPAAVATSALSLFAESARQKGVELVADANANLPAACIGDPSRIKQVLVNLISNAIKFTATGHVRVTSRCDGARIIFGVHDTGIGIDSEHIGRLFRPFEQADASIARRFGGTGLGLTITQRLVELMGGTIVVRSKLGTGSTFEVRLPLRPVG